MKPKIKLLPVLAETNSVLQLLGVPENFQSRAPSAKLCPKKFTSLKTWQGMFELEDFTTHINSLVDVEDKWKFAIQVYLKLCSDNDEDPFNDEVDRTDNTRIASYLARARRKIVTFMDATELFTQVTIRFPKRFYGLNDKGFVVRGQATLRNFKSAAHLVGLINNPKAKFIRSGSGTFQHVINSTTRIYIKVTNSVNALIWYEIRCPIPPYIPSKKLTKFKIELWIDRNLYLPVVRTNKFRTIRNRNLLF